MWEEKKESSNLVVISLFNTFKSSKMNIKRNENKRFRHFGFFKKEEEEKNFIAIKYSEYIKKKI